MSVLVLAGRSNWRHWPRRKEYHGNRQMDLERLASPRFITYIETKVTYPILIRARPPDWFTRPEQKPLPEVQYTQTMPSIDSLMEVRIEYGVERARMGILPHLHTTFDTLTDRAPRRATWLCSIFLCITSLTHTHTHTRARGRARNTNANTHAHT